MNSFLKKLGHVLAKIGTGVVDAAGIAAGVGPIISPFLGSGKAASVVTVGVNDLTAIAQQVVIVETALQGKTGADKMAALIPLVGNILATSQIVSGKKIANQELYTKAIQEFAQAAVDLANAISEGEAKTE